MPLAAYAADLLADAVGHGTAFQVPDDMFVHLCTTTPSKAVAGTSSGLGSHAVTMSTDWTRAGDTLENTAQESFGNAVADAAGVAWLELWDSADQSGNRWLYGALDDSYSIVTGQPVYFPAGALRIPVV